MDNLIETDLELYKVFYVTAKCGNITQAAQKLFLTQPSVSKYIQKMEQQLGCTLFHRSKRGVSLTEEGKLLLSRIEPAWQLIASAEKELQSRRNLESGTISIVSTEMSFKSYVLPTMESFMRKFPGIRIKFANALNANMIEMLQSGSADIAILHEPFKMAPFMNLQLLEDMDEYAVCGKNFRHLTYKENTPEELCALPMISMPEGSSTMEYLSQYFARFGLEFKPEIELTTVELTFQAVESGLGIGILPRRLAEPRIKNGSILQLPVTVEFPKRKVYIITNSLLSPSPATGAFIEELLNVNKNL